jgi:hypothetical protein
MFRFIILSVAPAAAFRISTLRAIVGVEMMNISFRQKISREIFDQSQIITHFNNAIMAAHSVDTFYIVLFFTTLIVYSVFPPPPPPEKIKHIAADYEHAIEVFFVVFMVIFTRNVEIVL